MTERLILQLPTGCNGPLLFYATDTHAAKILGDQLPRFDRGEVITLKDARYVQPIQHALRTLCRASRSA